MFIYILKVRLLLMNEHKLVCIRRCQKTPSHCEKAHELPEYQENQDKTTGH